MKDKYILIEEDEEHIEIERETLITKTRKYFNWR